MKAYGVYETVASGENPHRNLTAYEVMDFISTAENVEGDEIDTFLTLEEAERCFEKQKPVAYVTENDVFIASVITLEVLRYGDNEEVIDSIDYDFCVCNYEEA